LSALPHESANATTFAGRRRHWEQQLRSIADPQARFAHLVEHARRQPALPETFRLDHFRVHGCPVRLWLMPEFHDGRCRYRSDSDAVTLKAVVGLLCELASDLPPEDAAQADGQFLEELGLLRQLAESRRATVLRVAEQIRDFALRHCPEPPS
jgi:cysteine desulfuration protein SufE